MFRSFAPAQPQDPITTVLENIQSGTNTIRIVINFGGGAGNQKAAFTLMRKLRSLGFQGRFDVCYHENVSDPDVDFYKNNIQNIQLFAPAFNPTNRADQHFIDPEFGELYFRRLAYQEVAHDIPYVELALTAADHHFGGNKKFSAPKATLYHCANYVKLNPSGWGTDDSDPKTVDCFTANATQSITDDARLKASYVPHFDQTLITNPELAKLLESIQDAQHQDKVKFEFIYGLLQSSNWLSADEEIQRLIIATLQAKVGKPVVMVLPYDLSIFSNLPQISYYANLYDARNFKSLTQKLQNGTLPQNKVTIVFTNKLPEACFEALATESFFTVDEGCNLEELMEATQHPHIHGGRQLTELLKIPSSAPLALRQIQSIQDSANDYLENPYSQESQALLQWITLLAQQDPAFIAYLEARHRVYLDKPDMVEQALSIIGTQQPDCSLEAFIGQVTLNLSEMIANKTDNHLQDKETVLFSRLHHYLQCNDTTAGFKTTYFELIQRFIDTLSTNSLQTASPSGANLFFKMLFHISVPREPATSEGKKNAFEQTVISFLMAYVDDVTLRQQIQDQAIATFVSNLRTAGQSDTAQPESTDEEAAPPILNLLDVFKANAPKGITVAHFLTHNGLSRQRSKYYA